MSIIVIIHSVIAFVFLDFAIWYTTVIHNINCDKKRKFKGILHGLWDKIAGS